ncbi:MAG: hypothetical protein ACREVO_16960 [Steroidobacteraceae bacterium]
MARSALLLLASLACVLGAMGFARQGGQYPRPAAAPEQGAHDFDFELGRWQIHIRRARSPLAHGVGWDAFDGTTVNCRLWDGSEIQRWEARGPTGHIEGLTLRLYGSRSGKWTLYGADRTDGALGPPVVGQFRRGRGVFLDREPMNGRMVLVRSVWSDITANAVHFEASVSADAGKTWRPIRITDQTRLSPPADCGGLASGLR